MMMQLVTPYGLHRTLCAEGINDEMIQHISKCRGLLYGLQLLLTFCASTCECHSVHWPLMRAPHHCAHTALRSQNDRSQRSSIALHTRQSVLAIDLYQKAIGQQSGLITDGCTCDTCFVVGVGVPPPLHRLRCCCMQGL